MKTTVVDIFRLRACGRYYVLSALTFLCTAIAPKANAQDTIASKNGVKVYVKEDRSAKMKMIIQAQLFRLECSTGDAFRIGAGVEGYYFLPKLASFHGELAKSYFNLQKMNASTLNKGSNALSGFSIFEVGGRFHIVDKKGLAKHKLVLSSNTSYVGAYTVTSERYIKPKLPCRKIFAARGGLYRTTAPVSTDMNSAELKAGDDGAVKTKDGTIFSDVYFTNAHTTGVYVGLSRIINRSVRTSNNVKGYEGDVFFSSLFKEVYADVLFAGTTFDPFVAGGKSYAIESNAKGSFQTQNIGWRVGEKMVYTRKRINMGFSFEMGNRPGVKGRGAYFGTGWYMAFVN